MAPLINLLPWAGWGLWVHPDFVALSAPLLVYRSAAQDRVQHAWLLGLLMDVADGSLFGQHALAYTILAFAGIALHRRVEQFSIYAAGIARRPCYC